LREGLDVIARTTPACFGLALSTVAWIAVAQEKTAHGDTIDEVLVTGQYVREVASAKSDVPLLETPQAISVVNSQWLQNLGITRLADALRGVAGVSRSSTYGYYDAYQIRGFDAAYGSVYLDGLLSANVAGANNELAGLEQIEVVKGPASMLFGSAPLGGIVNLVSKRPRDDAFINSSLTTGSYNHLAVAVDANAPLTVSSALLGRVNLLYRQADDFVRFANEERIYIAPSLTWNINAKTRLTFLGRYERDRDSPWSPVTAWGTVLPSAYGELPSDFSVNNASGGNERAIINQDHKQIGYVFDHEFSSAVSVSQTLRYTDRQAFWNNWIFAAGFVDSNIVDGVQLGHVMGRYIYGPFRQSDDDFAVDTRLNAKFDTAGVRHSTAVGVDYRRNRNSFADGGGNFDPTANPLDLHAPDYGSALIHDPAAAYGGEGKAAQIGVYLQDHLSFGARTTVTIGGRWDRATTDAIRDEKFSPRVGATYELIQGAALYGSWSKSFTPQPTYMTSAGDPLPPETGRNIETGVKLATQDGRLSGMLSLFDLTRQKVATADPANPFFYVVSGEQRSRGVELEGIWRPTAPWTLALAYTWLNAEVTRDNVFVVGTPLANVPKNNANVYIEYVVPQGPLAHLGMHVSYLYNSRKNATLYPEDIDGDGESDAISLFTLPGYSIVDVGVSYPVGAAQLRLNVNNVFDKRFFPDACCVDRVTPGEPRNWQLSMSASF
jgi:iron complex outermembrane receptor protein